jgi:hypothetical protein
VGKDGKGTGINENIRGTKHSKGGAVREWNSISWFRRILQLEIGMSHLFTQLCSLGH